MLSESPKCCSALKQPLMRGDWKRVCGKLYFTALKPPNPDLKYNYTVCIAMFMVFQYLQHIYTTISFYFAEWQFQTIMDKSVDTFEQNKRFLSASLRKFK